MRGVIYVWAGLAIAVIVVAAVVFVPKTLPSSQAPISTSNACGSYRQPNYLSSTGFTVSPHPYYYDYLINPNGTGYMNFSLSNPSSNTSESVTNTLQLFYATNGSFISNPEIYGINLSISPKTVDLKPRTYQLVVGRVSVSPSAPLGSYIVLEQGAVCGPDYGFILTIGTQPFSGPLYKGNLTG